MCIKEKTVKVSLCCFKCRWFTRTKLFVYFDKSLFSINSCILFKSCFNSFVVSEELTNFVVRTKTQCTDKCCNINFSVLIYSYIEKVILVSLVFKPSTTVRNNSSCIKFFTCLVMSHSIIYTW